MRSFSLLSSVASLALLALLPSSASAKMVGYPPISTTRDQMEHVEPMSRGYHYDPNVIGGYRRPVIQDVSPNEEPITLGTPTSFEGGFQFSRISYEEKDVGSGADTTDVHLRGLKYGFDGRLTYNYKDAFVQLEGRFAFGDDDYKGSGKRDNESVDLGEARLLGGYDFLTSRFGFSPYTGVGFRDLYNDGRGITSTGYYGYRRENHTVYIPIGITARTRVDDDSRVNLNFEYDQFMWGEQYSELNDVYYTYPNFTNQQQNGGYGLRGELLYERRSWGFGPFFNYWNVNQSENKCASRITPPYIVTGCAAEPHNSTIEYGLRFRYRFF